MTLDRRDYNTAIPQLEKRLEAVESVGDKSLADLDVLSSLLEKESAERERLYLKNVTQIQAVQATANGKNKIFRQSSQPTSGMADGDIWFDTSNDNKISRYNGSSWVAFTLGDDALDSLSANKLTAGTIDASVITVSNLDAGNITSGQLDASHINVSSLHIGDMGDASSYYTSAQTDTAISNAKEIKVKSGTPGAVVHITDGCEYPALELVADIDPIQPNNYDDVWFGGGGKNICVPLEGTKNGIVRTLNDDGTVAITGKSTANSWSYLEEYYDLPYEGIDVGDTISIYSDVYIAVMAYNGSTSLGSKSAKDGNSATYTIPADTTRLRIIQYPKSVTPVVDEEFDTIAKFWVSKSAYSSWTPYENICPIYGHDHCTITRVGKNLFNPSNVVVGYLNYGSAKIATNANARTIYVPCEPNTQYTVSKTAGARFGLAYTKETPAVGVSIYGATNDNTGTSLTITTGADAKYLVSFVYLSTADTATESAILGSVQVELGETATTYEPYNGQTYTTPLGRTVYGGTLDVVNGVLTVNYAKYTVTGNETFTDRISAQNRVYFQLAEMDTTTGLTDDLVLCNELPKDTAGAGRTTPSICIGSNSKYIYLQGLTAISGVTDLASFQTWLSSNPVEFTYKLATPLTISVSPKDIELLSGTNYIWTDTGDITSFQYAVIDADALQAFGDAREVAVKYVTDLGEDGIIVHPENNTSNYAKINAEGMDIVKNDESIAFYGEFSRVGRDNRSRTITSPKGVSMYTDDNVLAFSIGSSVNTGSVSVNEWVNYYATLNTSSTLTVPGLSQGAVGGDIQLGITASYYDYNSVPNRQKTETNENIYFTVGTSATETWTVGASNDYTITIVYDGSTSFTITNDIPITEQNYIRVAFVEYDKIDIIADVKLGSKTLSDGVWYTEARVVLWENESPKSNFSAQTVSLGAVEQFNYCDELEITFINSVSELRHGSARGTIDRVNYSDTYTMLSQGAQTKLYSREVYFNYVGQVVFANGNYDGTSGAQYCVPQQIIGIRHI